MKNLNVNLLILASSLLLASCAQRTVAVNFKYDLARIHQPVEAYIDTYNAKTGRWEASPNKVTLPAGLFVGAYKAPPVQTTAAKAWKLSTWAVSTLVVVVAIIGALKFAFWIRGRQQ